MPITREDYIDKSILIEKKKRALGALSNQRKIDEEAINVEFNVNECNARKALLAKKYADLAKIIQDEINNIINTLDI